MQTRGAAPGFGRVVSTAGLGPAGSLTTARLDEPDALVRSELLVLDARRTAKGLGGRGIMAWIRGGEASPSSISPP